MHKQRLLQKIIWTPQGAVLCSNMTEDASSSSHLFGVNENKLIFLPLLLAACVACVPESHPKHSNPAKRLEA